MPEPWSIQGFVAWEEAQPDRYEFADGIVRMMVGGTITLSTIIGNVFAALRHQLKGKPCRAHVDVPKIVADRFSAYPDVPVVCNTPKGHATAIEDPTVVIEVLSQATRSFDLTAKWDGYRRLPSLRHGLFIDQDRIRVDVLSRDGTGWHVETLESLDAVAELPAVGCRLALADVYAETEILPPA